MASEKRHKKSAIKSTVTVPPGEGTKIGASNCSVMDCNFTGAAPANEHTASIAKDLARALERNAEACAKNADAIAAIVKAVTGGSVHYESLLHIGGVKP